jgi:hypothetical protein
LVSFLARCNALLGNEPFSVGARDASDGDTHLESGSDNPDTGTPGLARITVRGHTRLSGSSKAEPGVPVVLFDAAGTKNTATSDSDLGRLREAGGELQTGNAMVSLQTVGRIEVFDDFFDDTKNTPGDGTRSAFASRQVTIHD